MLTSGPRVSTIHRDLQDVAVRRPDRKRIRDPMTGEIELDCLTLTSEGGSQRLLRFAPPPGSDAAEQLRLARAR